MLVQLYNQNGSFIKQVEMSASKGLNNGYLQLEDMTDTRNLLYCLHFRYYKGKTYNYYEIGFVMGIKKCRRFLPAAFLLHMR